MALTLTKRQGTLGCHLNGRNQLHGDEDVPACDFKISGILMDEQEINTLYDDEKAHSTLYNKRGKVAEPSCIVKNNGGFVKFLKKYENSYITLWFDGEDEPVKISEAKLDNIELGPTTGGQRQLMVQVKSTASGGQVALLYVHQNKDVYVNIRFGKETK